MRRRPIGQILVEKNEISEAELAAALALLDRLLSRFFPASLERAS